MRFTLASWLAALSLVTPSETFGQNAPSVEEGWVTEMTMIRLRDEFADRPAEATMSGSHPQAWANFGKDARLPADLATRIMVNESFVLLDVDETGKAAGCRPLRPSTEPRLDARACWLLMQPGYFSASLLPPKEPLARSRWVMGVRWETLTRATAAARRAAAPQMRVMPARLPRTSRLAPANVSPNAPSGDRRALAGSLNSSDYMDLTDRTISNGAFLAELAVDAEGKPTNCTTTRSSGNEAVDGRTCALLMQRGRYSLQRDKKGKLVPGTAIQPVNLGWMLSPTDG